MLITRSEEKMYQCVVLNCVMRVAVYLLVLQAADINNDNTKVSGCD